MLTSRKLPPKSKRKKSIKPQPSASSKAEGASKLSQESVLDKRVSPLKSTLRSSTSKATALSEARAVASNQRKVKKQAVVLKSLTKRPASPSNEPPLTKRVLRQKSEDLSTKVVEKFSSTRRSRRRSGTFSVGSGQPTLAEVAQAHTTVENQKALPETFRKPEEPIRESDPYELSVDENGPPTTTAALQSRLKRKFFSKGRAERLKQSTYSAFTFFRGKFRMGTRKPLRNLPTSVLTLREEHRRIAATTIWLPVPDASRPPPTTSAGSVRGGVLYSTPVSGAAAAGGPFAMLSSRPLVALRGTDGHAASLLASPILPSKPSLPESVVAVSTADVSCNTWNQLKDGLPPPEPLIPSPLTSPILPSCSGDAGVTVSQPSVVPPNHSTEQTLSVKSRSQRSSLHSPTPRSTSSRGHSSHEEDVSNYKEWLDVFNAQLEPYEDFNLTID
ncbi:unnamed protein product [Schistocephalus solidus]|uniref:Disco-interacting protein 2 homolog A n=1 Tax=Schistocephalus solidus TaxID=70667 RepID=A0A183TDD7_SCHSO|nr:unnamed protein product [Schistocephalus solidus]